MQNDLASNVAKALSERPESSKEIVELIRNQVTEIQKRNLRIVDLEDKNEMLQKNVSLIVSSNKQLECMIETLKQERVKLLEEIEELKSCGSCETKIAKKNKTKKQEQV